jgi:predicted Zn finger-like uncharacterized protein
MDVRCELCWAGYEVDDSQVVEGGVRVRCSACGNVFWVERNHHWRIRFSDGQPNGHTVTLEGLAALQRWIVEGRVGPEDKVSINGAPWVVLGELNGLAVFFSVPKPQNENKAQAPRAFNETFDDNWQLPLHREHIASSIELDKSELAAIRPSHSKVWLIVALVTIAIAIGWVWRAKLYQWASIPITSISSYLAIDNSPKQEHQLSRGSSCADRSSSCEPEPDSSSKPDTGASSQVQAKQDRLSPVDAEDADNDSDDANKDDPPENVPTIAKNPSELSSAQTEPPRKLLVIPAKATKVGEQQLTRSFDWYLQQGRFKRKLGQVSQALKHYQKAEQLQPESIEPVAGKAFCLVDMGRIEEALALFEGVLKSNPRYSDALIGMAEIYKVKGDVRQAMEYYRQYLRLAPDGPESDVALNNLEKLSN